MLCHALIGTFIRAVLASVGVSVAATVACLAYAVRAGYDWRGDKFFILGLAFAVFWPFMISLVAGIPFAWWRARRLGQSQPHRGGG